MLSTIQKIFIACLFFMFPVYGAEYVPSTSPNITINKSEQKSKKLQKVVEGNIITFSEFSTGTHITDQYADKGIIFGGDSPFITHDASNPTSPVLSGTPTFDGAIEGSFVDPVTHDPTTVNHFELDGGYFNNLSSTKLSWFNADDELIREVLDSKLGVQHFSVDDEGIASFRIEIISQEDAGYAIDNISFKTKETLFNHVFNLDKITHKAGSSLANTFTIYFKNLEAKNGFSLEKICSDYTFKILGAETISCDYSTVESKKSLFKVSFKISDSPYNIEAESVSICNKGDECKEIEDIKRLSIYATDFDVSKNGFSFRNGSWNKLMFIQNKNEMYIPCFRHPFDGCTETQITYIGKMQHLIGAIKDFLPPSKRSTAEEDIIGYFDNVESYINKTNKKGGAMCYGLAVSSIASFNNSQGEAWGATLDLSKGKSEIKSIFEGHWDKRKQTLEGANPFTKTVYSYDKDNKDDAFHSVSKIAYYYTNQAYYKGGTDWVGKHNRIELNTIDNMNKHHSNYLKDNKVSIFTFDIKHNLASDGGHGIVATSLITYKNTITNTEHSVYVLHDNNFVNSFSLLDFTNNFTQENFIYETSIAGNSTDKYDEFGDFFRADFYGSDGYYGFDTSSGETDELFVYGKPTVENRLQIPSKQLSFQSKENIDSSIENPFPEHISVTLFGAKILKVTDTQTQDVSVLNPVVGELKSDKAYLQNNLLFTKFLLPNTSTYKVEVKKYKQYPDFKVYIKVPDNNGKIEVINYENLATNQDDETLAYFFVGKGNDDKNIKRDGESEVVPNYDEPIDIQITSATFVKAIASNSGVKLSWNMPNNPNLLEVAVVRKENTQPETISDGNEVYRGTNEAYIDSSARNNTKYYYDVFAISKNGEIAEGDYIFVDTHQATLFGYVKASTGNPVKNTNVVLKNGVGLIKKAINTETTDKNGYFSFGNLPLGAYLLEFSHSSYSFVNSEIIVELDNKNKEVHQEAIGVPKLALTANQVMKVGETEVIVWSGLNIGNTEPVDIEIYSNETWSTIASNVQYGENSISWVVTAPVGEVKFRVSLHSNPEVFMEKDVMVFDSAIPGDANADGKINSQDLIKIINHILGVETVNGNPDCNTDGLVNSLDTVCIINKILGA